MAFQLTKRGFDVMPLAGGLDGWRSLDLPLVDGAREASERVALGDD